MKWKNKGNEFSLYKNIFRPQSKVYIYGEGELGKDLRKKLAFAACIGGFIDNDLEKQGTIQDGIKVYGILDAMQVIDHDKDIVVVAIGLKNRTTIMQQMRTLGFRDGFNLFDYDAFVDFYISIYLFYAYDKLYFHSIGTTLTTICNFRCKGCLAFIPYNKCPQKYDLIMFENSIGNLFKYVDYVDIFQLSGGETFLYPEQSKLIEFIGENYRDKINILYTTTNGSIEPSDELCTMIKKYDVTVIVDDYSLQKPDYVEKLENTIHIFEKNGINYLRNKVDSWINLAPLETDNTSLSDEELILYCGACSQPWIELFENKLYSCNYAQYAMRAQMIDETENDYYKLENVKREELLEFRMKYTEKGYVDMCKHCAGYWAINRNRIKVAEQYES